MKARIITKYKNKRKRYARARMRVFGKNSDFDRWLYWHLSDDDTLMLRDCHKHDKFRNKWLSFLNRYNNIKQRGYFAPNTSNSR